jgi:hypothetical protein
LYTFAIQTDDLPMKKASKYLYLEAFELSNGAIIGLTINPIDLMDA